MCAGGLLAAEMYKPISEDECKEPDAVHEQAITRRAVEAGVRAVISNSRGTGYRTYIYSPAEKYGFCVKYIFDSISVLL